MMESMEFEGLLTIVLTLLLKCGYILIHVGCIPTTNVNNIYMQSLFNIGATTLVYILFGSAVTLGEDWKGLLGIKWISEAEYYEAVRAWSLFIHSSSIVQLVTAGRVHLIGDLIVSVLYSGLIYPIVIHSAWTINGWMRTIQVISDLHYEDVGGGSVIHLFGGAFAFGAMTIFGGRIINVNKLDHNSLAINAQATSTLGYFMVLTGTVGLMLQSPYIPLERVTTAQISSLIAVATGFTVTTIFYFPTMKQSYWSIIWILQGGLASLITLASGLGTYSPLMSFCYAFLGVSVYLIFSIMIRTSGLEDYCNIISINMLQGFIGSLLIAFNYDVIKMNPPIISHKILWQAICSGMIFFFGALCSITIYAFLFFLGVLRNRAEQEIYDDMSDFDRGCCPMMRRTLDPSSGDLIRPGYHTFIKFRRRQRMAEAASPETTHTPNQEDHLSLQEPHV